MDGGTTHSCAGPRREPMDVAVVTVFPEMFFTLDALLIIPQVIEKAIVKEYNFSKAAQKLLY